MSLNKISKKKADEKLVLTKVIEYLQEPITIVDLDTCIKLFPNYHQENPDFIVEYYSEYIGIELTSLISKHFTPIVLSEDEEKKGVKNLKHLMKIREKNKNNLLYEQEQLLNVAVEAINKKIDKLSNYVTQKVWIIAYANEFFNFNLLADHIEDKTVNQVIKSIRYKIKNDKRVEHIYLFSCLKEPILFTII